MTLYTRAGCHLCEHARREIEAAGVDYEAVDIDADPALRNLYNDEVPVVFIDGRKAFKYRLTARELARKLEARR
ncbi:MAG: glutaredoxin family protein [Bryobacteraceae bacterium]